MVQGRRLPSDVPMIGKRPKSAGRRLDDGRAADPAGDADRYGRS